MKYKVGDWVKVRSDLKWNRVYNGITCVSSMLDYAGRAFEIKCVDDDGEAYQIGNSPFFWSEDMFEDPANDASGMTSERAIREIRKNYPKCMQAGKEVDDVESSWGRALSMAATALERLTPIKPEYEGDGYADGKLVYDTWICPLCGKRYEVDYDSYKHCPNCGQAVILEEA